VAALADLVIHNIKRSRSISSNGTAMVASEGGAEQVSAEHRENFEW
jgi:hypothetical protein